MTQELMERVKMLKLKDETISKLKSLQTVEEAICQKCQNSLEESFIMNARKEISDSEIQAKAQQFARGELSKLAEQMAGLEKQVNMYRERVNYHESVEDEHKKNLEQ